MRQLLLMTLLLAAPAAASPAGGFDHADWDALLSRYVSSGLVDYGALSAERGRLDAYLGRLALAREPGTWSREEQLAFWINAYNAQVLALVLDHYPIRGDNPAHPPASVLQIEGIFKRPAGPVAGRALSLDQIEHEILRARFAEPRIHAALSCASASCPELRAEAFVARRLEEQLEDQSRRFVNDPARNRFDVDAGLANLSQIFSWFADDFAAFAEDFPALRKSAGEHAGALAFAARHLPRREREAVLEGRLRVELLPYDWGLNDSAVAAIPSR